MFQSGNALAGIIGHGMIVRGDKVTKRFFIASPHPTAHLMQVTQTKIIGIVYKNRIGVGNIQPTFNNCSAHQDIKRALHKIKHELL